MGTGQSGVDGWRAHIEAFGPERGDGLVKDLAAAAHDGDLRAVACELGGDLEADAGSPAGYQRRLALEHVRPERRLHRCTGLGSSNLAPAGLAVPERALGGVQARMEDGEGLGTGALGSTWMRVLWRC